MAFTSPIFVLSTLNTDINYFTFQTQATLVVMRLNGTGAGDEMR
jgi:hypothetical protein